MQLYCRDLFQRERGREGGRERGREGEREERFELHVHVYMNSLLTINVVYNKLT